MKTKKTKRAKPKRKKACPQLLVFAETLALRTVEELETGQASSMAEKKRHRVSELNTTNSHSSNLLEKLHDHAREMFYRHEGDPDDEATSSGWSEFGKWGDCKSKEGDLARDILYRIAEYRRHREEQNNQVFRLLTIGRLSMLLDLITHEKNAVLGASHRKATRRAGEKNAERMKNFLNDVDAKNKVQQLINKGHFPKRAREIVAASLVPPWRGTNGKPLSEATLRNHKIGEKIKK